jgi:hypothetical protein
MTRNKIKFIKKKQNFTTMFIEIYKYNVTLNIQCDMLDVCSNLFLLCKRKKRKGKECECF